MSSYKKRGLMGMTATVVSLIIGVGVAITVLVFINVLGGAVYTQTQNDINNIGYFAGNASYGVEGSQIQSDVKTGIYNGFVSMKTVGQYMPLIVLSVVIAIVLGLILTFTRLGGDRGQSAL